MVSHEISSAPMSSQPCDCNCLLGLQRDVNNTTSLSLKLLLPCQLLLLFFEPSPAAKINEMLKTLTIQLREFFVTHTVRL